MDRRTLLNRQRALERDLRRAAQIEIPHRTPSHVDDDAVRLRMAEIAASLGNAWELEHGFNPYAAEDEPVEEKTVDSSPSPASPPPNGTARGRWVVEEKYNPYHEEGTGRFTTESGAGFVSLAGRPEAGEKPVVGRGSTENVPASFRSPERYAARRESMIDQHARGKAPLDNAARAAQAKYDEVGNRYMALATTQSDAMRRHENLRDEIASFERDADYEPRTDFDRQRIGIIREAIAEREAELPHLEAARNAANEAMTAFQQSDWKAAQKEYFAERDRVTAARLALDEEIRERYVYPPTPATVGLFAVVPEPPERARGATPQNIHVAAKNAPESWQKGMDQVNKLIGKGAVNEARYPLGARIAEMRAEDDAENFASGRSFHRSGTGVFMHPNDKSVSTVVHEMGHWVENSVPNMPARIEAHIRSRTQGETSISLKTATGSNYRDNEITKLDKFADAYMGKDYGGGAHEFLSMGLQFLHDDPVAFAKKDPESFDFVQQILAEARDNKGVVPSP